ncbi:MAG TPA: valine--tRNA ligase [Nevskiaceae bacterium]|nr:valine--tRNA ligase [Nevskiaceae bacterium]
MSEMDKTFEPRAIEERWCETWEKRGFYKTRGAGEPFSIAIPPPNVTGTLHMGHAFQHSVMDALTRYQRMRGRDALWLPGTDHAGIATQMVVERNLAAEGVKRTDLGREKFLEKVWQWKEHSGGTITRQMRRIGESVDWSREAFTMSPQYSRAVIEHFVKLYEEGLIYRGKRLVNWDPVLQTAISDLEVEHREEKGKLWHLRYPLADGSGQMIVATTRPETMLGDTAVAVHPEDERYKGFIGKNVKLPLTDREIPVIADDYVDREFGSGVVKITPAHDFNDYALGQRHKLPLINIFTATAKLNDNVPAAYRGLDRFDARKRIVADLEAQGFLEKIDEHTNKVPYGDRSGVVLEPWLTDQWYVDLTRKKLDDGRDGGWTRITKPALDVVADGRMKFVPENWANTYNQWLNNIQDWCISRQLWWGHRIPAWYDETGKVYVARSEDEVRAKFGVKGALRQDNDVFDTWFSSDIWPFATLGWPDPTDDLKRYYPTSVLVTGFDIIFFWVARMVMMGLFFMKDVPFHEVYITGLVRDPDGNKMSKSKGNIVDPLDIVEGITLDALVAKRVSGLMQPQMAQKIENATRRQYPNGIQETGVDALRFTFLALASTGRDIRFDPKRAEGYRNFCNKIWNAARYVLMNCEGQDTGVDEAQTITLSTADRWIVSKLQRLEAEIAEHFKTYRFDLLATALYQFIWNEYCDWYLELSKPALQQGNAAAQRGTRRTLVRVLETWLRLLHPLMPFITEEIWQRVAPLAAKSGETIMLQPYPTAQTEKIDEVAEADIEWMKGFILGLRQIRGEMDLSPGKALPVLLQNASKADVERVQRLHGSLTTLAKIEDLHFLEAEEQAPEVATALLGQMKILVPIAGLIDKEAELARLLKQIAKLESDLGKTEVRINNPNFGKAPENVQEQARSLAAKQRKDLAVLREQHSRIQAL